MSYYDPHEEKEIDDPVFLPGTRVRLAAHRVKRLSPLLLRGLPGTGTVEYVFMKRGEVYVSFWMDGDKTGDRWTQHRGDVEVLGPLELIVEALDGLGCGSHRA